MSDRYDDYVSPYDTGEIRQQDPRRHRHTRTGSTPAQRAINATMPGNGPDRGLSSGAARINAYAPQTDDSGTVAPIDTNPFTNGTFKTPEERIAKERSAFMTPSGTPTQTERELSALNRAANIRGGGDETPGTILGSNRAVSTGMNYTGTAQPDGSFAVDPLSKTDAQRRISAYGTASASMLPSSAPGSVSMTEPYGHNKALVTTQRFNQPVAPKRVAAASFLPQLPTRLGTPALTDMPRNQISPFNDTPEGFKPLPVSLSMQTGMPSVEPSLYKPELGSTPPPQNEPAAPIAATVIPEAVPPPLPVSTPKFPIIKRPITLKPLTSFDTRYQMNAPDRNPRIRPY